MGPASASASGCLRLGKAAGRALCGGGGSTRGGGTRLCGGGRCRNGRLRARLTPQREGSLARSWQYHCRVSPCRETPRCTTPARSRTATLSTPVQSTASLYDTGPRAAFRPCPSPAPAAHRVRGPRAAAMAWCARSRAGAGCGGRAPRRLGCERRGLGGGRRAGQRLTARGGDCAGRWFRGGRGGAGAGAC